MWEVVGVHLGHRCVSDAGPGAGWGCVGGRGVVARGHHPVSTDRLAGVVARAHCTDHLTTDHLEDRVG